MRQIWEYVHRAGMVYYAVVMIVLAVTVVVLLSSGKMNSVKGSKYEEITEEPVILRMWYPWMDEKLYQKAFLDAVEEYNGKQKEIQIVPEGIAAELYREKLPAAVASNDTPDIYLCYTDAYLEAMVNSGKVLQLDDYLSDDIEDRLIQEALDTMSYDGETYGLGFAKNAGFLFVNHELFKEYGCDVPKNCEELVLTCRTFLDNGIVPLACTPGADRGFRMYLEALCVSEAGGQECLAILSGDKAPTEGFMKGVSYFCKLRDMGAFGITPAKNTLKGIEEEFYLSRIPMYYTENGIVGDISQRNSPLYGKISIVTFPGMGEEVLLGGISEAFVVSAATACPREAVAALEELLYCFSGNLSKYGAGIPVWILDEDEPGEENMLYNTVAGMAERSTETVPYWEFYLYGKESVVFMENSARLYRDQISPEAFVESLLH